MLEHSVIRIIGASGKTAGTGFVVGDRLAVTCAHVLQMQGYGPGDEIRVVFYHGGAQVGAVVLEKGWSDKDNADVGFLRLHQVPDGIAPARLGPSQQSINHPSKTIGYPDLTGEGKATTWTDTIGGVTDDDTYPQLFVQSTMMKEGFSGAPVFDLKTGRIVGMVRFGYNRQHGIAVLCVTSETIQQFLFDVSPHHIAGLKELPRPGVLPNPAPLPPGSRLDLSRNHLFTGREEDLHALAADLLYSRSGNTVALTQPVAAAGMGGIGKTQLAAEFCYRYGQFCDGVHWINAANNEGIGAEIAECGLRMGIQPWSDKQQEKIEITLREWTKSKRRIVVLDNLEEPSALAEWLPRLQNVHILATTRRVEWPPELGFRIQRLERFPRVESLRLMRKLCERLEHEPDHILGELTELLCNLPLAVDLAGRYLNERKKLSPQQYIEDLKATGVLADYAMSDEGANEATRHLKSLEATFEMSWNELDAPEGTRKAKEMYIARLVFRCAGYCAPAVAIPLSILRKAIHEKEDPLREDRNLNVFFDRGFSFICSLGLLEPADNGATIHPLLSEFARKKDSNLSNEEKVLPSLAKALNSESDKVLFARIPENFQSLRPHLELAAHFAAVEKLIIAGTLWNKLGQLLKLAADFSDAKRHLYEQALEVFERALIIDEEVYGTEHPDMAGLATNLGSVLKSLGDVPRAKIQFERALAIEEKVNGKDHPNVAIRASNLGTVLQVLGDLIGAKANFERALTIGEQVYGNDHPRVAVYASNLGSVLQALRDMTGAKVQYERALTISEKALGSYHPNVATFANNLGSVLEDVGDQVGAKTNFERALAIGKRIYGNVHPQLAIYAGNLGGVLQAQGDLVGAKAYYEQALTLYMEFPQLGHENVLNLRESLKILEAELRAKGLSTDSGVH